MRACRRTRFSRRWAMRDSATPNGTSSWERSANTRRTRRQVEHRLQPVKARERDRLKPVKAREPDRLKPVKAREPDRLRPVKAREPDRLKPVLHCEAGAVGVVAV